MRTDTNLFKMTAHRFVSRRSNHNNWPYSHTVLYRASLNVVLQDYQNEGLLTVLTHETNLGIQGGLRRCLEQAAGEFVLPLDADDLMTRNAISVLTKATLNHPKSDLFYTDEDILIQDKPAGPFYRPSFDPVLAQANSYVWHAIFFRRTVGLELGAFTNSAAEYAQDWDLLLKFALAGRVSTHIPFVAYHWRQHERSLSNSGENFEGSGRSIQGILEMLRNTSKRPELYAVSPSMIDVGIPDFFLRRVHIEPPSIHRLSLVHGKGSRVPIHIDFPFVEQQQLPR